MNTDLRGATVVATGLTFPECPRWHEERLWFSDFYSHTVFAVAPGDAPVAMAEVAGQPAGLGWHPDGGLVVASMNDRLLLRITEAGTDVLADLSALAGGPLNDLLVDPAGRAYVGNFGFDYFGRAPRRTASLLRVEPDGTASPAADDLHFPNGMAMTPDGSTLIVAETFAHRLSAFSVDAGGGLHDRRVWADLADLHAASPDGITLDVEGCVWLADASGHRLVRVAEGGEVRDVLATGREGVYACCLGGEEGRTLFLCLASTSSPRRAAEERGGRIVAVDVEVAATSASTPPAPNPAAASPNWS